MAAEAACGRRPTTSGRLVYRKRPVLQDAVFPLGGRAGGRKRKPGRTRCKPGSVPRRRGPRRRGEGHFSGPDLAAGLCPLGRASGLPAACPSGRPGPGRGPAAMPAAHTPLLGLAPGGVCRADDLTAVAVRSYRTVSPLPRFAPLGSWGLAGLREAVCFLWHCPDPRPAVTCGPADERWALPIAVVQWCPDFPPPAGPAGPGGERPSAHPATCDYTTRRRDACGENAGGRACGAGRRNALRELPAQGHTGWRAGGGP